MRDNSLMAKDREEELQREKLVTASMETLLTVSNKVRVNKRLMMVLNTKVPINRANCMAMEKLNGKLVQVMKDNLKMEHLILKEK